MNIQLRKTVEDILNTYWFIPVAMVLLAVLLSSIALQLDKILRLPDNSGLALIWGGGAEGARSVLATIASSMITVAGVTFSIVMVAFSQASSQLGPRVLRSFMKDRGNQVVLGTFIATFIYCLLTLRAVRNIGNIQFVPHIAVTIGVGLALASLVVLIYFFHHTAETMQAPYVIASVARDLMASIEKLYPYAIGEGDPKDVVKLLETGLPEVLQEEPCRVNAPNSGYLQIINDDKLIRLAKENGLILRLNNRPGHFVVKGNAFIEIFPGNLCDDKLVEEIWRSFSLGRRRSPTQDLEFVIEQLVEIAIRALSPSVNDSFTAIACIDWLGAALARLSEKSFPFPYRFDSEDRLRVIVKNPLTFRGVVNTAFDLIRQSTEDSAAVKIRLLEALSSIAIHTQNEEYLDALKNQADLIRRSIYHEISEAEDRDDIEQRYQEVLEIVEGSSKRPSYLAQQLNGN